MSQREPLQARYYYWRERGQETPGVAFFRGGGLISHMTEVAAIQLANEILETIEKERRPQ